MSKYIQIDRKKHAKELIIKNKSRLSADAQKRIDAVTYEKKTALSTHVNTCATGSTTGPLFLKDSSIQVRQLVSLSQNSEIKLLDANKNKVKGEQSFQGNTLGEGTVAEVIDSIRIGYQTHAAADQVANLIYDQDFDAFLRNSNFVVRQDNQELLKIPMTRFDPRTLDVKDRFVALEIPVILIGGTALPFEFILETPSSTAVPANSHYLEIETKGIRA